MFRPADAALLERWLRREYPHDVLMPVAAGGKAPMHRHAGGAWGWDSWSAHRNDGPDLCVVLRELCVVDVDCPDAAAALERRFPGLREAPCERTKRGFHYWFERSPAADRGGYFTSHGKVVPGVDFKSVCATGTGSVVVVAPSSGKAWVRRPWSTPVREIPDDLLEAVAGPAAGSAEMDLVCADGARVRARGSWLLGAAYLEPWASGDFDFPATVPVAAPDLEAASALLAGGEFLSPPGPEELGRIRRACDLLGVPPADFERAAAEDRAASQAWMAAVSEDAWRAERAAEMWRAGEIASDALTVEVDEVPFLPLPDGIPEAHFVWGRRPDPSPAPEMAVSPGAAARVERALPEAVARLLRKHAGRLVAAGGFVAACVCDLAPAYGDIDLFAHSCGQEQARDIEREVEALGDVVCRTRNATTVVVARATGDAEGAVPVQMVRRLHADRAEAIAGFDISACQVMAGFGAGGRLVVEGTPAFVWSASRMAFFVDFGAWGEASVHRVVKYVAKGFDALVPGIDRDRPGARSGGAGSLLDAEADVRRALGPPPEKGEDVPVDRVLAACSSRSKLRSGYGDLVYARRLAHALRAIWRRMVSWAFPPPDPDPWPAYERRRRCGTRAGRVPSRVRAVRAAPAVAGL